MSFQFSKFSPYIITLVCFYTLVSLFFYPKIFENKVIETFDIGQWAGGAERSLTYQRKYQEPALWNDGMFGGMPNYQIISSGTDKVFPSLPYLNFTFLMRMLEGFLPPYEASTLFLGMFSFWLLALSFRVRMCVALIGALAFGLSTYNMDLILAGHSGKFMTLAVVPLLIAGMRWLFDRKYILGAVIFTLGLGKLLAGSHYQIIYYSIFVCGIFIITEIFFAFKKKSTQSLIVGFPILLVAVVLLGLSHSGKILLTREYAQHTIRGAEVLDSKRLASEAKGGSGAGLDKDYAFSWSMGKIESLSLLFPDIMGRSSSAKLGKNSATYKYLKNRVDRATLKKYLNQVPLYWGSQPFVSNGAYAGIVMIFFFILAWFVLKKQDLIWLLTAIVLLLFISWGKNLAFFNYFMFDHFPLFNKFRAVGMAQGLIIILVIFTGTLGLNQTIAVITKGKSKIRAGFMAKLKRAYYIIGGLGLLVLITTMFASFVGDNDANLVKSIGQDFLNAIRADRRSLLRSDALLVILISSGIFGLLFYALKKKFNPKYILPILGSVMVIEMTVVAKRLFSAAEFEKPKPQAQRQASAADQLIQTDTSDYRVLNLAVSPFNDASTSYFHRSIGGYHAAKLKIYNDLISSHLGREINGFIQNARNQVFSFENTPVINMLNTKYFKFNDSDRGVLRNPKANGSAWFVEKLNVVSSSDEELNRLATTDLTTEALVDGSDFELQSQNFKLDSTTTVQLTKYAMQRLYFETDNPHDGFLVFSEIYYPEGWQVKIDGKDTPIYRTNYVLRGIKVPKGKHQITMAFEPETFFKTMAINKYSTYAISLLWFIGLGFLVVRELRKLRSSQTIT